MKRENRSIQTIIKNKGYINNMQGNKKQREHDGLVKKIVHDARLIGLDGIVISVGDIIFKTEREFSKIPDAMFYGDRTLYIVEYKQEDTHPGRQRAKVQLEEARNFMSKYYPDNIELLYVHGKYIVEILT